MTHYVIRVYLKLDAGSIAYKCTLPYVFVEEPINICRQLNEMLPNWKHMIAILED